jgi:hypothetical protein
MNTKSKNYKKYLKVKRRSEEIRESIKKLGYVKLENPYQKGWDAHFILRDDIKNREDADVLQYIIDTYGSKIYSRTKDFKAWDNKGKCYFEHKPSIKDLTQEEWESYVPTVQKWFKYNPTLDKPTYWWSKPECYVCTIPEWFLKVKVTKHWVTEYKEHDEVLVQELDECYDLIQKLTDYRGWYKMGHKSGKWYKTYKNRKLRRKIKMDAKHSIVEGDLEELPDIKIYKNILYELW